MAEGLRFGHDAGSDSDEGHQELRSGFLLEPGEAVPVHLTPTESDIAADFDAIAETFYAHKHDQLTDFDVVGWPALHLMLNGLVDGKVVGDLAGGTGVVTDMLLKNHNPEQIYLVDISKKMIEIARREITDKRVMSCHASVTDMNCLANNSLDLAVCVYGLDYMNVPKALEEISRVVKPEGHLIALVPHPSRNQAYWKAGGSTGTYPDGIWIAEAWPGTGGRFVRKQFFSYSAWTRMIDHSPFKLSNSEEPVPQEHVKRYAPDVYERYVKTGRRIMIWDLENM